MPGTWRPSDRGPALAGLLPLLALAAGCSSGPLGPQADALADARARWEAAGPEAYVFEFTRSCFCGPDILRPLEIRVVEGDVTAAVYADTGLPVDDPTREIPTIDDLFAEIEDAIQRDAFRLEAEYDPVLGFPTEVAIDYLEMAVDEEMAFEVRAFEDLPVPIG